MMTLAYYSVVMERAIRSRCRLSVLFALRKALGTKAARATGPKAGVQSAARADLSQLAGAGRSRLPSDKYG
jgi:hypothetical protein